VSISLFLNSIQSEETKKLYDWCLRQYGYDRLKLDSDSADPKQIEKEKDIDIQAELKKEILLQ
jgi:hypothetical protein